MSNPQLAIPPAYKEYLDQVWAGEAPLTELRPGVSSRDGLVPIYEHARVYTGFANVVVIDTGDGLVMIDSGEWPTAGDLHRAVREWSMEPVAACIFTHGHVDHVFGVMMFDGEAAQRGAAPIEVIAHEAVAARFDRYKQTAGYNSWINRRQFQIPNLNWPERYRYPNTVYRDAMTYRRGELTFELVHARGETDDATYVWIPELRTVCTGDLFIWNTPNAGNPQKAQRYPLEWAAALREIQRLGAEVLLPGHGVPIVGADRIDLALGETAELLEVLCEQTITLMNSGARLDEVLAGIKVPEHLLARPYLKPAYDEPEFVVRNLWRLYGGWYDQNPAHLKPAPEVEIAAELAQLVGGVDVLAARARALLAEGNPRLAAHLAEWAAQAAPQDREAARVRAEVFGHRADEETSTMAKGMFTWAAAESRAVAEGRELLAVLSD